MRGSFWFTRCTEQRFRLFAITAVKSLKIKLILCCCMSLTVLAFTSSASSFLAWTNELSTLHHPSVPGKGYTIVMNTWKRCDLLKQSIKHCALFPRLESVHIVWSEPSPPSDSLVNYLHRVIQSKSRDGRHLKLKFDINKEDSLNNRFKEIKNLEKVTVKSLDMADGGQCGGRVHIIWCYPRQHLSTKSISVSLYTNEMPRSIREYITKNRNCEDIAMSILVANATGAPPIWVRGNIYEIGSTGISSLGGHSDRRTECLNRFAAEYGRMPLVSTT